ncbi:unnamed protein product [Vitrella brassicaformis CCMP3155]|uniref:Pyrroloquinoline quinone-dependent pyranose dehydrogenase beta-propeller domain-containing protein n=2 Tax=Vitrella brassicaformis TaxID=1169539 RepID=A0A0G4EG90_VITBC|nr:unnamed protein product [Vitrella brassicaformis CCMP3155]|eukprot:CEL94468.1 unnamed protein product [Vitrella brassicaformis CCMP3155]
MMLASVHAGLLEELFGLVSKKQPSVKTQGKQDSKAPKRPKIKAKARARANITTFPEAKDLDDSDDSDGGEGLFAACAEVWDALLPEGFRACILAEDDLRQPRQMVVSSETDDALVFIDRVGCSFLLPGDCKASCGKKGDDRIVTMKDVNRDGRIDQDERFVLWEGDSLRLNHGLAIRGGYLLASNATNIMRWPYKPGQTSPVDDKERVVVVKGIEAGGCGAAKQGHLTRTLMVDDENRLYVSIGSLNPTWPGDRNSSRAQVRRFLNVTDPLIKTMDWTEDGKAFVHGLRNSVGLAFDQKGRLWGVDTNDDDIPSNVTKDLGGDEFGKQNPAEEMNLLDESREGKSFGYPRCWTEGRLPPDITQGHSAQWAVPGREDINADLDDEWCRNISNNQPPELPLQAHASHVGIAFLGGKRSSDKWRQRCEETGESANGGFPCEYGGDAFLAQHGSCCEHTDQMIGKKVTRVLLDDGKVRERNEVLTLFGKRGDDNWGIRPVSPVFDSEGRLYVSSDGEADGSDGKIIMIYYDPSLIAESSPPTPGFSPHVADCFTDEEAGSSTSKSALPPHAMRKAIDQCADKCRSAPATATAGEGCGGFAVDEEGGCDLQVGEKESEEARERASCRDAVYTRDGPPGGYVELATGNCRSFSTYPAPSSSKTPSYSRHIPEDYNDAATMSLEECTWACDGFAYDACVAIDYDFANPQSYPCHIYAEAAAGDMSMEDWRTLRVPNEPRRWCLGREGRVVPEEVVPTAVDTEAEPPSDDEGGEGEGEEKAQSRSSSSSSSGDGGGKGGVSDVLEELLKGLKGISKRDREDRTDG